MNLKEEYKKQTGNSAIIYTQEYVDWLEEKLKQQINLKLY